MRLPRVTGDRVRLGSSLALALGAILVAERAPAQPDPLAVVAVRYEAQAPCPDRTVFIGNLLARTQRVRLTEHRPDAVVFAVRILGEGQDSLGTLEVVAPGREPTLREVRAQTCGEVVEALALVAALTIDPDAETAPLTSDAVEAAASSLVLAKAEVGLAGESPSNQPVTTSPVAEPPPPVPAPPPPPPPAPERGKRGFEVGAGGQLEREAAPFGTPFWAWRGFVDASPRGDGLMRPSVGISVAFGSGHVEKEHGGAELDWVAGRLDLCPVDLARATWVTARPCVAFDAGSVSGSGQATDAGGAELDVHDARFAWASGTLLGRADLEPVGPLVVRLEAGLVVPFTSGAGFEFRGESWTEDVVAVPSASFVAGAGLGLRFP